MEIILGLILYLIVTAMVFMIIKPIAQWYFGASKIKKDLNEFNEEMRRMIGMTNINLKKELKAIREELERINGFNNR